MRLSKEEAICLVLAFSKNNEISSKTKLNKLLAKLNLYFIPIDFDFSLNRFGSMTIELNDISDNNFFGTRQYEFKGGYGTRFILKDEGRELYNRVKTKLQKFFTNEDFQKLKENILNLSELSAEQISDYEHKKLLVDPEDRHKLIQKVNSVYIDMKDLYYEIDTVPEDNFTDIKLRALIEYCFYLSKYLKEKRFRHIGEDYDFGAYMFDYYFLYLLAKIIPFLNEQIKAKTKDRININKYYNFLMNEVKDRYPFSLENENLKELLT